MPELVNYHDIKGPDSKEIQIEALLRQPGVHEKIQAMAATLSDCFNAQTKVMVDMNYGAEFEDVHTEEVFIYEGTMVPFDFDALTTVIMREAQHPLEELDDQGYALFRRKALAGGERYIVCLKDFIKMFAIKRWNMLDFNSSNQKELTKDHF